MSRTRLKQPRVLEDGMLTIWDDKDIIVDTETGRRKAYLSDSCWYSDVNMLHIPCNHDTLGLTRSEVSSDIHHMLLRQSITCSVPEDNIKLHLFKVDSWDEIVIKSDSIDTRDIEIIDYFYPVFDKNKNCYKVDTRYYFNMMTGLVYSTTYDENDERYLISGVFDKYLDHGLIDRLNVFDKQARLDALTSMKIGILRKEYSSFAIHEKSLVAPTVDLALNYNDGFIDVSNRIVDKLSSQTKGIVLLHGVPGSGKTTYIKWLASQIPNKTFVYIPLGLINSLSEPELISTITDRKDLVFVIEDCERYIESREGGDISSNAVASILNMSDGILSDIIGCQFICTFNSALTNIDEALLRDGRLIAEYFFDNLTKEKAVKVSGDESIGSVSLVYALAVRENDTNIKTKKPERKFGFV